jgi:hypothetical protein
VPSHNMASNSALAIASLSGVNRRGRQVTGGPGVVDGIVTHLALNSSGASEVLKLGENVVDWCTDDFDTGNSRIGCLGRCRQRCFLRCGMSFRGYTQRSEPVSIMNCNLVTLSVIKRRPLVGVQVCATADVCCTSFPWICMYKAGNTF